MKPHEIPIDYINTPDVPASSLYSQALRIGGVVLLSGIVGIDKTTGSAPATVGEQTAQAIRNCEAILKAADASLSNVVRVLVLLKDPKDFDEMNRVYAQHFSRRPPARAVARLGVDVGNLLVSLMMTAVVGAELDVAVLGGLG